MNKLINWLSAYKKDNHLSYRELGLQIGFSYTHVHNVLKGRKPLTWDFCAAVAENLGMDHETVFIMAGLWPDDKQGDQPESQSPRVGERHNGNYT